MALLIDKPLDDMLTERAKLRRRLVVLDSSIESAQARLLNRLADDAQADGWEGAFDGELQNARRQ